MNFFQTAAANLVVYQFGWTLLHSVWQALVVAVLLAILLRLIPERRYVASCSAMLAVLAICVGTFLSLRTNSDPGVGQVSNLPDSHLGQTRQVENLTHIGVDGNNRPKKTAQDGHPVELSSRSDTSDRLTKAALPWIVAAWLVGTVCVAVWHLGGWILLRRSCRRANVPAGNVLRLARACAAQLRLRGRVQVSCSPVAATPAVIEFLQPVILLPAALVTGLTTQELRAVLLHELAHVRRHDFLVNLFQSAVESLLFYHPAVWWISRRIRAERENCCDDLASDALGNRFDYSRALTTVSEHAAKPSVSVSVAASGANIQQRIHRLLSPPRPISTLASAAVAGLLLIVIAVAGIAAAMNTGSQQSKAAETENVVSQKTPQSDAPSIISANDKTAGKLNVLMVDSDASGHFRFLTHLLRSEESITVHTLIQNRDVELNDDPTLLKTFPAKDDLFAHDVVVLGNVDPETLSNLDAENLKSFVEVRGGGLLFVAGQKNCPWKYSKEPLKSLLPVETKYVASTTDLAMPQLSARAQKLPIFHFADDQKESHRIWRSLSMGWYVAVTAATPDAETLASLPIGKGIEIPVFVVRKQGAGRVMYHATDQTWRWRRQDHGEAVYRKFWLETVAFLAKEKNGKGAKTNAIQKQAVLPKIPLSDWTKDLQQAQGTWNVMRHWTAGTGFGATDGSGQPLGPRVLIEGDSIKAQLRRKDTSRDNYEYVIKSMDSATNPKQIDVAVMQDGMTVVRHGIYKLENDLIKCEFASPGNPRPTRFEAAIDGEKPTNYLVLRRVKRNKPAGNQPNVEKESKDENPKKAEVDVKESTVKYDDAPQLDMIRRRYPHGIHKLKAVKPNGAIVWKSDVALGKQVIVTTCEFDDFAGFRERFLAARLHKDAYLQIEGLWSPKNGTDSEVAEQLLKALRDNGYEEASFKNLKRYHPRGHHFVDAIRSDGKIVWTSQQIDKNRIKRETREFGSLDEFKRSFVAHVMDKQTDVEVHIRTVKFEGAFETAQAILKFLNDAGFKSAGGVSN